MYSLLHPKQDLWFNRFIQINRKPDFYWEFSLNNIDILMQLVDRNNVFKDSNTYKIIFISTECNF